MHMHYLFLPVDNACAYVPASGYACCTCAHAWIMHVHMFLPVDNVCAYVPASR